MRFISTVFLDGWKLVKCALWTTGNGNSRNTVTKFYVPFRHILSLTINCKFRGVYIVRNYPSNFLPKIFLLYSIFIHLHSNELQEQLSLLAEYYLVISQEDIQKTKFIFLARMFSVVKKVWSVDHVKPFLLSQKCAAYSFRWNL
jgi:hypothetical protein